MIFRRDIEPCCTYCKHATELSPERVGCLKRGVMGRYAACPRFAYDPLKRRPDRPKKLPAVTPGEDEFRL